MSFLVVLKYDVGGATGMTPVQLSAAFEDASKNFKASMRFVGPHVVRALEEQEGEAFASEGSGGPIAGSWAPLTLKYAAWKKARYPGRKKLVLIGKLKTALTTGGAGSMRAVTDTELTFGTSGISYASLHQTGTRKMVARPPFDFSPTFDEKFKSAAQLGIVDALRDAGIRGVR